MSPVETATTLKKGTPCLWLGFHRKAKHFENLPIDNEFFKEQALHGHIAKIISAGQFGAEIECWHIPEDDSVDIFETVRSCKLSTNVEELLAMTTEQAQTLSKSVTKKSTNGKKSTTATYSCEVKGCGFTSPSPQGLGTHRVKTHNLEPRKRTSRKIVVSTTKTKQPTTSKVSSKQVSPTEDWKKNYTNLLVRYNRMVNTLKNLCKDATI